MAERPAAQSQEMGAASSTCMGAGVTPQSKLPEEGPEQGPLVLPAGVSGEGQTGVRARGEG